MSWTARQRRFVAFYLGEAQANATTAARLAGYANPAMEGSRLLKREHVRAEVQKGQQTLVMDSIATREEVLSFLSGVMRSQSERTQDRIKAAEHLAKIEGFNVPVEPGGRAAELRALPRSEMIRKLEETLVKLKEVEDE